MDTGAAIVIAAGALVVVFIVTKRQEAQTAMHAANITNAKANDSLTGGDTAAAIAAGVATYYGGPAAGRGVLALSGKRL